jgi:small subunit ribosomal protein S16
MVRLRLRKVGSKAQASFRIVAAEREHPRDGRFLENVGSYNPRTQPAAIVVDEAAAFKWLKNGAQPSESVEKLFKITGTRARFERLKKGEAAEALLAEAEAAAKERAAQVNPKTSAAGRNTAKPSKRQKAASEKKSE